MAKIKLNLDNLNPDQAVSLANQIKTAMTGNANFTTPNPPLTSLDTAITAAQDKIAAYNSIVASTQTALTDRHTAVDALCALIRQLASYVENIAAGDASIIQSAGMSVRAERAPAALPDMVQNLSITAGDNAGELDLQWDPVIGTRTYEAQISPDPMTNTSWVSKGSTTKSKMAVDDLTSGTRCWARVRATNSAGTGAWSDPATKIVP